MDLIASFKDIDIGKVRVDSTDFEINRHIAKLKALGVEIYEAGYMGPGGPVVFLRRYLT